MLFTQFHNTFCFNNPYVDIFYFVYVNVPFNVNIDRWTEYDMRKLLNLTLWPY